MATAAYFGSPAHISLSSQASPIGKGCGQRMSTRRSSMKTKFWMGLAVSLVCLCMLMPSAAFAQAVYGSILGTVTDPQGAAVAGAKVTVINQRKGGEDTTTTNADGNYSVTHLVPDSYTIRVEAAGFKISQQKDVIVQADAGARVDLQFQVGGATETVEVTAEAPQ